jgi:hypothetical protein
MLRRDLGEFRQQGCFDLLGQGGNPRRVHALRKMAGMHDLIEVVAHPAQVGERYGVHAGRGDSTRPLWQCCPVARTVERGADELGQRHAASVGSIEPSLLVVGLVPEFCAGQVSHGGSREVAPLPEFVRPCPDKQYLATLSPQKIGNIWISAR